MDGFRGGGQSWSSREGVMGGGTQSGAGGVEGQRPKPAGSNHGSQVVQLSRQSCEICRNIPEYLKHRAEDIAKISLGKEGGVRRGRGLKRVDPIEMRGLICSPGLQLWTLEGHDDVWILILEVELNISMSAVVNLALEHFLDKIYAIERYLMVILCQYLAPSGLYPI